MLNSLTVCCNGIAAELYCEIWRLRFGRHGEPFGAVVPHNKVIHNDGGEEDEEDYPARRKSGTQRRHKGSVQFLTFDHPEALFKVYDLSTGLPQPTPSETSPWTIISYPATTTTTRSIITTTTTTSTTSMKLIWDNWSLTFFYLELKLKLKLKNLYYPEIKTNFRYDDDYYEDDDIVFHDNVPEAVKGVIQDGQQDSVKVSAKSRKNS